MISPVLRTQVRHIEKYGSIHIAYPSSLGDIWQKAEQEEKRMKEVEIIGYSAIEDDECYGYDENECLICDSIESCKEIFEYAESIEEVTIKDLRKDYGYSCGKYAFEPEAYKRFKNAAEKDGLEYELKEEKNRKPLYIVRFEYDREEEE